MNIAGLARPAVLRNAAVQRIVSQGTGALAPNKTMGCLHQLPASAIGVQFELTNMGTTSATVYNAAYALSAGINDYCNPLNGSGAADSALWVPITSSGSASLTVPSASGALQPERLVTDMMSFSAAPPARIDGGEGILVFYRQWCVSGIHTVCAVDLTVGGWNGNINGLFPGQYSQTLGAGWVSTLNLAVPGSFGTGINFHAGNAFSAFCPHAVMPLLSGPSLTIMSVGDSILSGVASRGAVDRGVNGVGFQIAKALNASSRPALHRNGAVAGMANADYIADATNAVGVSIPDIVLLQPYSANDAAAQTKAGVWTQFQQTMVFAGKAAALGTRVVLLTSPPFAGPDGPRAASSWEAARLYANALAQGSGLPYIDADLVVGTGNNPVSYWPKLSDDYIHPNDTGAGILAAAGLTVLRSAYGVA